MPYPIRTAAVIGSGTMGGAIAVLLAGVGLPTLLLDVASPGETPAERSAVALAGLERVKTARPPSLFAPTDLDLITVGNLDDDLDRLAQVDWIIEVVVERLDVKQALMRRIVAVARPDAILSTNTSGLPIRAIAEGFDDHFSRRFLGTHFFNPPRYLRLLEIIPHPNTDPALVGAMTRFAADVLGKGVVLCKDEPNFIGNRFLSILAAQTLNRALDHDFSVDEVDALTGPLIGRPKSATFRLLDLIGIDVMAHIARNLYPTIPNDPAREVLRHPKTDRLFERLLAEKRLGNKSGQGFYKQVRNADGSRAFYSLDLATLDYRLPTQPKFEGVDQFGAIADVGERIRALIESTDRAGRFLWHHHAFYLAYASQRVPEITDSIVNIDNAQKWGFGHALGPFEIWDAINVGGTAPAFEAAGYPVAPWVMEMLAAGHLTFYLRDETGRPTAHYSPQARDYVPVPRSVRPLTALSLRAASDEMTGGDSAGVVDMGDGVALLDLRGDSFDESAQAALWKALDLLDRGFDALVIGGDGERFLTGTSPRRLSALIAAGPEALERDVRRRQELMQAVRFAQHPVIVAPYGTTLGAGAELLLSAARVVAHVELYAGLNETGLGLIPSGGACAALLRRWVNPVAAVTGADPLPQLFAIFDQLMSGKVSASATEARTMKLLDSCDRVVMSRDALLETAKGEARHLAIGYRTPRPERVWAGGRDAYQALVAGYEAGSPSEPHLHIARALAAVLCGGADADAGWVDERDILDLERAAFLSLAADAQTVAWVDAASAKAR